MLTFAYIWVLTLAPLPVLVWWLAPPRRESQQAIRVPFLGRLREAGAGTAGSPTSWLPALLVSASVWLLLLFAASRPQWLEPPIERNIPTRDMLLLVDLSGSMDQQDFTNVEGKKVNRLVAVKEVLGEFLSRREGDRVGLIVFGSAPFLQAPFTTDLALCQKLLDETAVGMAGPRTALGDAIGLGIRQFENSDAPAKTMIALTDGNDTGSGAPPTEAARIARDREITIHTVAIGDPTTAGEEKLDEATLKEVARMTGGEYFLAMDRTELVSIYDRLDAIETREVNTVSHRPKRDLFFYPLLAALLISLLSHVVQLIRALRKVGPEAELPRLRVNAATFDLEVEQ